MEKLVDKVLCAECRSLQHYDIHTEQQTREWNGTLFKYNKRVAICRNCGNRIAVPGLDDLNETEFDVKCREETNYILVDEIKDILIKYDIEKRPLSKVLGLGEHTIENYLKGHLPSKRYSDMLRRALASYTYMQNYYASNKEKLNKLAAEKLENKLDYYSYINSHDLPSPTPRRKWFLRCLAA